MELLHGVNKPLIVRRFKGQKDHQDSQGRHIEGYQIVIKEEHLHHEHDGTHHYSDDHGDYLPYLIGPPVAEHIQHPDGKEKQRKTVGHRHKENIVDVIPLLIIFKYKMGNGICE